MNETYKLGVWRLHGDEGWYVSVHTVNDVLLHETEAHANRHDAIAAASNWCDENKKSPEVKPLGGGEK